MRTGDGAVLTIRNRVTLQDAPRYAVSVIEITVPEGP